MTHLDPDLLALLALEADAASEEERLHLQDCPECRAEVRRFVRAVDAIRRAGEPLTPPGPRVWPGIAAALSLDAADPLRPTARAEAPGRRTRIRRRPALVAGLVVVALAVGGVAFGLLRPAEPIASAALQPFPGWVGSSGTAVLERLPDGREVVRLTARVPADPGSDHEVWLMTDGARRLVSLGLLHGTAGTFSVPVGLDLSRYHLVDVSDEPRDGNPGHSGDSIVRGALRS